MIRQSKTMAELGQMCVSLSGGLGWWKRRSLLLGGAGDEDLDHLNRLVKLDGGNPEGQREKREKRAKQVSEVWAWSHCHANSGRFSPSSTPNATTCSLKARVGHVADNQLGGKLGAHSAGANPCAVHAQVLATVGRLGGTMARVGHPLCRLPRKRIRSWQCVPRMRERHEGDEKAEMVVNFLRLAQPNS